MMTPGHISRKGHDERNDLTGEHTLGDAGQIVLAVLFFTAWTADTFFLGYTTLPNRYLPLAVRIAAGSPLLVLSIYLAWRSTGIVFREVRQEPGVIRDGLYNHVRHPMYLSELMLYLGLLMLSLSLAATAVWIAAALFLHHISRHEEKLLLERFGEEYELYLREVPMWLPRLGGGDN